jgi:uroporphyrinogen-III synthase
MKTLADKIILVTKAKSDAEKSFEILQQEGAEIIYFPTIKIRPIWDSSAINEFIKEFSSYDYVILTSANAMEIFSQIATSNKLNFSRKKIAAVGKATADKCVEYNLVADLVPDEFSAKGLLNKFSHANIFGKKILIPGSSLSGDKLTKGLQELGAVVNFIPVYDADQNDKDSLADELEKINLRKPDVFVFTSPSSFINFCGINNISEPQDYFGGSTVCAIGTTTEKAIRDKSIVVNIVPETFSLVGVAEAIIKYFHITANIA